MGQFDGQPSIRWSLRGLTEEGDEAWLIRGIARKLYHCPGCHGDVDVGAEHTVVQYVRRLGRDGPPPLAPPLRRRDPDPRAGQPQAGTGFRVEPIEARNPR